MGGTLNCRYYKEGGRKGEGEKGNEWGERERERGEGTREKEREATCMPLTSNLLRSRMGDFSSLHLLIFFLIS